MSILFKVDQTITSSIIMFQDIQDYIKENKFGNS